MGSVRINCFLMVLFRVSSAYSYSIQDNQNHRACFPHCCAALAKRTLPGGSSTQTRCVEYNHFISRYIIGEEAGTTSFKCMVRFAKTGPALSTQHGLDIGYIMTSQGINSSHIHYMQCKTPSSRYIIGEEAGTTSFKCMVRFAKTGPALSTQHGLDIGYIMTSQGINSSHIHYMQCKTPSRHDCLHEYFTSNRSFNEYSSTSSSTHSTRNDYSS